MTPDWLCDWASKGTKPDEALYHPRLLNIPENLPKPVFQPAMNKPPTSSALAKSEVNKITTQAGKLGVSPARLPGPPQLGGGGQRLPGPPVPHQNTSTRLTQPAGVPRMSTQPNVRTVTPQPSLGLTISRPSLPVTSNTIRASGPGSKTAVSTSGSSSQPAATPTIIQSTMPMAGLSTANSSVISVQPTTIEKVTTSANPTSTTTVTSVAVSQVSGVMTSAGSRPPVPVSTQQQPSTTVTSSGPFQQVKNNSTTFLLS